MFASYYLLTEIKQMCTSFSYSLMEKSEKISFMICTLHAVVVISCLTS